MEVAKRKLLDILSLVKAWHTVIIIKDSDEDGCFDIVYAARPVCDVDNVVAINTITVPAGDSLFGNECKIDKAIMGYLVDIRDAINTSDSACILHNQQVNGCDIRLPIDKDIEILSDMRRQVYKANCTRTRRAVVNMSSNDFTAIASNCIEFAARQNHAALEGAYFHFKYECMDIVASDGIKLIRYKLPHEGITECGFIIPIDVFDVLRCVENVHIEFYYENFGSISSYGEGFKFTSTFRYIDGKYPDYDLVITKNIGNVEYVEIMAADMLLHLKGVYNPIIELTAQNGCLTAKANAYKGEGEKDIGAIQGTASRDMQFRIKKDVLCSALKCGGNVKLFLKNTSEALVWQNNDKSIIKLFMPMYVKREGYNEWGIPTEVKK